MCCVLIINGVFHLFIRTKETKLELSLIHSHGERSFYEKMYSIKYYSVNFGSFIQMVMYLFYVLNVDTPDHFAFISLRSI